MDEVLEIGEDGCFEIPVTVVEKPATIWTDQKSAIPQIAEILPDVSQNSGELFGQINQNEYKIVRDDNGRINIVLCCGEELHSPTFRVSERVVLVDLAAGPVQIELPVKVEPSTACSKYCGRHLVIKIESAKATN